MQKAILVVLVTAVVAGGGGFYGGMQHQKGQSPPRENFAVGAFAGQNGGRGFGGSQNGGFINGTIIAKDATSITLQMSQGGSTKIVLYGSQTSIGKAVAGTPADLVVGENVSAQGVANSDGSITAQMIQIRPAGMGFGGRNASSTPR